MCGTEEDCRGGMMVVHYKIKHPLWINLLISLIAGIAVFALLLIYESMNALFAFGLGIAAFMIWWCMLWMIRERYYNTVTYLDEEDTERLRQALLKAKEKEEQA